ncbi:MAG: tRNA pseudouridine(38-40) synthase TruA [bacterium]
MYNYKLVIEYDGKNFKGWQKQKYSSETVQEQIETSIEKILNCKIILFGAGRTDSGVSAYNQVANFKYKQKLNFRKFIYSLNSVLPASITVKKISNVSPDFHSRYSAKKREYIYKVTTGKKSIERDYYYKASFDFDFKKIDEFFKFILKLHYFKVFCKNKEDRKNFLCKIYDIRYKNLKSKNEIIFFITANRFLHSMVRAIVGCALDIGRKKIILKNIKEKIKKGEKINVCYLPANALFLKKIYY